MLIYGAGGGGRTRTVSLPRDFESRTSANSITPATVGIILQRNKYLQEMLKDMRPALNRNDTNVMLS